MTSNNHLYNSKFNCLQSSTVECDVNKSVIQIECDFTPAQPGSPACDVLSQQDDDVEPCLMEDYQQFPTLMETEISIRPDGHIQLLMPLRDVQLPNNKRAVYNRTKNYLESLCKYT